MPNGIAQREFDRLNDPARQQADLNRRLALANPQLQAILASTRSDLNRRGLFSSSPVSRASLQAGSQFASGISQNFFAGLEQRRTGLIGILAQIEEAERERKARERSSLFEGIGGLLGTGAGFLLGGPFGAGIGSQLGGQLGGQLNTHGGSFGSDGFSSGATFNPTF